MARFCWIVALVACVGLAGCKKDQQAGGKRKIVIGLVAKSKSNDVFQAAHQGALQAAREWSEKAGVEVEIRWETPDKEDAQAQAKAIRSLASMKVAGIAVACSDTNNLTGAINDAVDAGVPVVCFDSDAPQSKRMCYYGTNDIDCGRRVMEELGKEMQKIEKPGKRHFAILAGNQSAPNLQKRVDGVKQMWKEKYPDFELVGVFYHGEDKAQAKAEVIKQQATNPQIEGWAMIGGWPLFAENALPWEPGTVKVVSVDALPPQLSYVKSGHVQMLLAQNCYGWGQKSVDLIMEKVLNNKSPEQEIIYAELTPVTRETADEFAAKWKQWLGK